MGNVQRTRSYVTGRVFWGALTLRLTRDATSGSATDSKQYKTFGDQVNSHLAFTYFYPAIAKPKKSHSEENQNNHPDYEIPFPWDNESQFRRRFLSSYTSTALAYPQQAVDEGLLHEVEFLSPRTLDQGEQVYLVGYVFEKEGCDLQWQDACQRLQMGGERGYGWGDVKCGEVNPLGIGDHHLFGGRAVFIDNEEHALVETTRLLAHTSAAEVSATGEIEPLVGREWKVANQAGQHVEKFADPCWVPGSNVARSQFFKIEKFGIWHSA